MQLLFGVVFGGSVVLLGAGLYDAGLLGAAGTFVAITTSTLVTNRLTNRNNSWDDLSPENRFLPLISTLRELAVGQLLVTRPNLNDALAVLFGVLVTALEWLVRSIVAGSGWPPETVTLITLAIVLFPTYTFTAFLRVRRETREDTEYESRLRRSIVQVISATIELPEIRSHLLRAAIAGFARTLVVMLVRAVTILLAPYLFGNSAIAAGVALIIVGVLVFYEVLTDMVNHKPELLSRMQALMQANARLEKTVADQSETIRRLRDQLRPHTARNAAGHEEETS